MRFLKGQITLEYMVLSLVVLVMLAISVSTLIEIQGTSSEALDNIMFRKSALDLHSTVEEVCALGVGNQREVYLSRGMIVSGGSGNILFQNDTIGDMSLELLCSKDISSSGSLSGTVMVINNEYEIEIR